MTTIIYITTHNLSPSHVATLQNSCIFLLCGFDSFMLFFCILFWSVISLSGCRCRSLALADDRKKLRQAYVWLTYEELLRSEAYWYKQSSRSWLVTYYICLWRVLADVKSSDSWWFNRVLPSFRDNIVYSSMLPWYCDFKHSHVLHFREQWTF